MWIKTRPNVDPDGGHSDDRYFLLNTEHMSQIYISGNDEYPFIEVNGSRLQGIFYPHPSVPAKHRHEVCKRIMGFIEQSFVTKPANYVIDLYNYRNDIDAKWEDK